MNRPNDSGAPLGWGGKRSSLPQERERMVRCAKCGATGGCQTYRTHQGRQRIGACDLPVMPVHGKRLAHAGCGGDLELFDQPLRGKRA